MMYSPEPVAAINRRLIDYFGYGVNNEPRLRVVWSEDCMEKRLFRTTPEGFVLLTPIVREVPKYRQYIQNKYILEQLSEVPEGQQDDIQTKISYEPLWVFEDANGNALPPKWEVIIVVMKTVAEQMDNAGKGPKYKSGLKEDNTIEAISEKEQILSEALFGNESDIGDALAHGSGVGYGNAPHKKLN